MSKQKFLQIGLDFLPAKLHKYKDGYRIEYYVRNPLNGELVRQRLRVNTVLKSYKKRRDAMLHIDLICETINAKLRGGYNPFFEGEDARLYEKLSDVADKFLSEKSRELRPDTMRSYSSIVTSFCGFVARINPAQTASTINKTFAIRYLDSLIIERNVSNRTYNNQLKGLRCFFNWCVEKCYSKENPFNQLKAKKKEEKKRVLIPADIREKINEYLIQHNKGLLLVCKLVYGSLIRPAEIRRLQVSDIDFKNHCIVVRGENAKNHNTRFAALTSDTEQLITEMNILQFPSNYLIIGKGYIPNTEPLISQRLQKDFAKMRKDLKLPPEMQLYSFRDTGITEMLQAGIPDITVMKLADHSDLSITSIYARHADPNLIETIREKQPKF